MCQLNAELSNANDESWVRQNVLPLCHSLPMKDQINTDIKRGLEIQEVFVIGYYSERYVERKVDFQ